MRKTYIYEHLREACEIIEKIKSDFPKISTDPNVKELLIGKVLSCLNLLRSSLDYCCQDIYEIKIMPIDGLTEAKRNRIKKYFPYGINEYDFKSRLGKSLPKLKQIDDNIYNLIESIQPYKIGNNWLYDFCTQTNKVKHDSPKQKRKDEKVQFIGGNAIKQTSGTVVIKKGSSVNGFPVNEDIKIEMNTPLDDLAKKGIDVFRITETSFEFEENGNNVIELLEISHQNINDFISKLYKDLENT